MKCVNRKSRRVYEYTEGDVARPHAPIVVYCGGATRWRYYSEADFLRLYEPLPACIWDNPG